MPYRVLEKKDGHVEYFLNMKHMASYYGIKLYKMAYAFSVKKKLVFEDFTIKVERFNFKKK